MLHKLSETEIHLLVQALDLLLASKQDAFRQVSEGGLAVIPLHLTFTPHDFGIPQIFDLMGKIDGLVVSDELESGVPA
ncbi:MAG: hypothetical protein ACYC4K_04105 [Thiobacillus sp.]